MPTATGHTRAILASKVTGTDLYDASGEKIGKVEDTILDKTSNRIMFAVVSVGGVTTTSQSYYPMPWSILDFNEEKNGYVVPCSRDQLAKGPAVSMFSELTSNDGTAVRDAVYSHFKVAKDW